MSSLKGRTIKYKQQNLYVVEELLFPETILICYPLNFEKKIRSANPIILKKIPDGRFIEIKPNTEEYYNYFNSFVYNLETGSLDSLLNSENKLRNFVEKLLELVVVYGATGNTDTILKFATMALEASGILIMSNDSAQNFDLYLLSVLNLEEIYRQLDLIDPAIQIVENTINQLNAFVPAKEVEVFNERYQDLYNKLIMLYTAKNEDKKASDLSSEVIIFFNNLADLGIANYRNYHHAATTMHLRAQLYNKYSNKEVAQKSLEQSVALHEAVLTWTDDFPYQKGYVMALREQALTNQLYGNYSLALDQYQNTLNYLLDMLEKYSQDTYLTNSFRSQVQSFYDLIPSLLRSGNAEEYESILKMMDPMLGNVQKTIDSYVN